MVAACLSCSATAISAAVVAASACCSFSFCFISASICSLLLASSIFVAPAPYPPPANRVVVVLIPRSSARLCSSSVVRSSVGTSAGCVGAVCGGDVFFSFSLAASESCKSFLATILFLNSVLDSRLASALSNAFFFSC